MKSSQYPDEVACPRHHEDTVIAQLTKRSEADIAFLVCRQMQSPKVEPPIQSSKYDLQFGHGEFGQRKSLVEERQLVAYYFDQLPNSFANSSQTVVLCLRDQ